MKLIPNIKQLGHWLKQISVAVALCTTAAGAFAGPGAAPDCQPDGLVVHEWGTFTSVQGGDGVLIPWQTSIIGDLPQFVYTWMQPGLNRRSQKGSLFSKSVATSLQRMETPVIYFYSDRELSADVTVQFPKGFITEWYPQAMQVGPATPRNKNATTAHIASKSLIHWKDVRVLPPTSKAAKAGTMLTDINGTHYFAARETHAALLRANNYQPVEDSDEYDKFLFYRGTGDFTTPLTVTVNNTGLVSVENTGSAPLADLFFLNVHDGMATWSHMEKLPAGKPQAWRTLDFAPDAKPLPMAEFRTQIGAAMAQALENAGLYAAEAKAMVKTWNDAWFAEEGTRVLYILPRKWTDGVLPMELKPQPQQLVRVMVGRSEVIPPEVVKNLAAQLRASRGGDLAAKTWLEEYYKKMGRFASPAVTLAQRVKTSPENKPVASARTP